MKNSLSQTDMPEKTNDSIQPAKQEVDERNELVRSLREMDPKRAMEIAQQAYDIAQKAGYTKGVVDALVNQSHCNGWLSQFPTSLSQGLEALKLSETLPAYSRKSDLYLAIARAYLHLTIFDEAAAWGQFAQQQAVEERDLLVEADAFNMLGVNYYRLEQYERALDVYEQAVKRYRDLSHQRGLCRAFINTAEAYSKQNLHDKALEYAHEAMRLARETDARLLEAYALHTIGQMHANQGAYAEALTPLEESIPIAHEVGNQYVPLVSIIAMGQVHARWGQTQVAISFFQRGLEMATELNNKLYIYRCHESLAQCYEHLFDWKKALEHFKQFHDFKEIVFNEQNMTRIQGLEITQQVESTRKEAEFYQLRNADLEREIARRIQLEEELQQQAATDPLTKVANRRHFIEKAGAEITRANRHNRPLAVALIDLDHLKQINDTCGHAVGDQAFLILTRIFQENIRPTDIFARFGGDEFVLLLLETDATQSYDVLERIRRLLASQVIETTDESVKITVSVGITSLKNREDTLDTLIARADAGLYQAKNAGRNRVCLVSD